MSVLPQPTVSKSGGFETESAIFTNFNDLYRFFQPKRIKTSLASPPLTKDIGELELVFDKTTLKLWTKVDGVARFVQFT